MRSEGKANNGRGRCIHGRGETRVLAVAATCVGTGLWKERGRPRAVPRILPRMGSEGSDGRAFSACLGIAREPPVGVIWRYDR